VSQYAVEVDPHELAEFRQHLEGIQAEARKAAEPAALRTVQASFRGELREYRDQAREKLARLREELASAAAAMTTVASNVSASAADQEKNLADTIVRLNAVAGASDLEEIRNGLRSIIAEIERLMTEIRRANQMTVAQLQDEIRLLHREIEMERRAQYTDPASGAWNRKKIDARVDELLRQNDPFCLIFISVRNLPAIARRHSRNVVEGTLKALIRRLHGMAGEGALIGRWSEQAFVVMTDVPANAALELSREMGRRLSGSYSVQENGYAHEILVQAATGVVNHGVGEDAGASRKRIDQLTSAL
jgi:GGDEF domain-containing protein